MPYKQSTNFINPYNFVSVDWKDTKRDNITDTLGDMTGVITCKLYTKTAIAIPDTASFHKDPENNHKSYEFMRRPDGQLMIPAGSLRGVIRSVYETVTESCFVTSDSKQRVTRRLTMYESGKPYLLVHTGASWELQEADRYLIKISDDQNHRPFERKQFRSYITWNANELKRHTYGEFISFEPGIAYVNKKSINVGTVVRSIPGNGSKTGYLYLGEVPPKDEKGICQTAKHFESIFAEKIGGKHIPASEELISNLKIIYEQYNKKSVNKCLSDDKKSFYAGVIQRLENNETLPVWYNPTTGKISLASIGRIVYRRTIGDMLGVKKPCTERSGLCKACALFGTANDEGKNGSRIRVTDAVLCGEEKIIPQVILRELASPHISYAPFYLEGSNCTYDTTGATMRGRKYYWHDNRKDIYRDTEKTERNATMDLVDGGDASHQSVFLFKIYFNKITSDQLEELKWVLTLGENSIDSQKCHKIGHGKPIGLGSVKITIEDISVRSYDLISNNYYNSKKPLTIKDYHNIKDFDKKSCKELCRITDMSIMACHNISYPFIEGAIPGDSNTAPYKWFNENWKSANRPANQPWIDISNTPKMKYRAYRKN